jgi:hypothetical protein
LVAETMEFSDQDLRALLNRALRSVAIATLVLTPLVWVAWGWRSVAMFLVGGAIAATGILEWRQLMTAVLARLNPEPDAQGTNSGKTARPVGPVLFWFFVRLAVAAAVLYVSLRSLDRKVSALLIGLSLALVALFIEAIRLFHAWSV